VALDSTQKMAPHEYLVSLLWLPYIIKDDFISLTTKQKERLGLMSIDQEQLFTYEVEEWEAS
jgi:hypothetical protein